MGPITIIKKIIMLGKKIPNPPFFLYSVHHYIKKDVPLKRAEAIAKKNMDSYHENERELIVPTYDGSNQSVHPDTLYFEEKYWLVVTPYPYGMEEYENPSLYCGTSINSLLSIQKNPIDRQKKHVIGFHLSDPCIFEFNNQLICAYRENVRKDGKDISFLHYKKKETEGKWSLPRQIIESDSDPLLSPAFYVESQHGVEKVYMVHVKRYGKESKLIHSELNENLQIVTSSPFECKDIPEGYYVWHIAIAYKNGNKEGKENETKYGLFLLRNIYQNNDFKLYYAVINDGCNWKITEEVKIPKVIKQIQDHPYKSCFIPNKNSILYSYIDNKSRYRMTVIDYESNDTFE